MRKKIPQKWEELLKKYGFEVVKSDVKFKIIPNSAFFCSWGEYRGPSFIENKKDYPSFFEMERKLKCDICTYGEEEYYVYYTLKKGIECFGYYPGNWFDPTLFCLGGPEIDVFDVSYLLPVDTAAHMYDIQIELLRCKILVNYVYCNYTYKVFIGKYCRRKNILNATSWIGTGSSNDEEIRIKEAEKILQGLHNLVGLKVLE